MIKLQVNENAYYQEQYESNGYKITEGPTWGYLVWKGGEVIKHVNTLQEAEDVTTNVARLNRKDMPTGWIISTGLNPDFVISVKRWAKESGRQVAQAKKDGDVDGAIQALLNGQRFKKALKKQLEKDQPYFVYDPTGRCRYILERDATKKWQAYNAE